MWEIRSACPTKSKFSEMPLQVPTVSCEETTEERCFNLINLEDTTMNIEKCHTTLAEPK